MIIKRKIYKEERDYSKLSEALKLTPGKKKAIKLWFKDRFTDGLEGEERKALEKIAARQKSSIKKYILSPA